TLTLDMTNAPVTIRALILSILLAAAAALLGPASVASAAGGPNVLKRPVTFQVRNVNRSALACPGGGAAYEVKGHLVGPASGARPSVTLYLHGFGFGEFL